MRAGHGSRIRLSTLGAVGAPAPAVWLPALRFAGTMAAAAATASPWR
jgi:hypothetical protein